MKFLVLSESKTDNVVFIYFKMVTEKWYKKFIYFMQHHCVWNTPQTGAFAFGYVHT